MERNKIYLEKNSFAARSAVTCLILAIIFRAIGSLNHLDDQYFLIFQAALPVISCALLILCIRVLGKKYFSFSVIPILLGVVFFALRIFTNDNISMQQLPTLHVILCIVLYVVVLMVFVLTVYSVIPTKWISAILFGAAFLFHLVVEDYPAIMNETASVSSAMLEVSVLCMILGMFFTSVAMRTFITPTSDKSKDVVPPIPGNPLKGQKPIAKPTEESFAKPAEEPFQSPATESAPMETEKSSEMTESVMGDPLANETGPTENASVAAQEEQTETPAQSTPEEQEQTVPPMFAENAEPYTPHLTLDVAPSNLPTEEKTNYSPEMTEIPGTSPNKPVITPIEGEDNSFGAKVGKLWDKLGHVDDKN